MSEIETIKSKLKKHLFHHKENAHSIYYSLSYNGLTSAKIVREG
jgi:hypothetical protein